MWWPSLRQQGVGVRCTAREGGAGGGKLKVRGVLDGDAPSFEAACKLAALFVVAEGGSPGPLCHAPPRGCSCQVAGSSEPLSHPRPLPSGQRAGLAPKVLRECWELAGVADGPASPWWRLRARLPGSRPPGLSRTNPRWQGPAPREHSAPPAPLLTRARALLGVPAVFTTGPSLVTRGPSLDRTRVPPFRSSHTSWGPLGQL